jgi:hypothetical protein
VSAAAEAVAPLLLQVEGMKCGGCGGYNTAK